MNHTDSHSNPTQESHRDSPEDFDTALRRARVFLEEGQIDDALELLGKLEKSFVRASSIFETLADAFLAKGDVSEGIRYKTLHQILKGTFRIAGETGTPGRLGSTFSSPEAPGEYDRKSFVMEDTDLEDAKDEEEVVPVTLAMAQELMRQGHYDRASRIFDRLLVENPNESSLKEAREAARRKRHDKHLLTMFQRWLTNIEKIRSTEYTV